MAITLTCPRCTHKQRIDDDQVDKEVPCKICFHLIKPARASKESASTQVTAKAAPKPPTDAKPAPKLATPAEDTRSDGVQTGPPPVKSTGRRKQEDEDEDDRPKTKKRDEARGRRPRDQSASGMVWMLIGGGALLAFSLVCGGLSLGAVFLFGSDGPEPIVHGPPPVLVEPPPPPPLPVPMPPLDPFIPQPGRPAAPPLNPDDPAEIARAIQYLQGAPNERDLAFAWLQRVDPNQPRRSEVARLLEPMVEEQGRNPFNNTFFPAYFRWATKDNVPSLLRLAEGGGLRDDRRSQAIQTLAKMKEPTAAEPIARRLGNFFDGNVSTSALIEMGPIAQPTVLTYFNHHDGNVRGAARQVLQSYKTPTSVLVTQCLTDLESAEQGRRQSALQWLGQTPGEAAQKPAVAKAINKSLIDENALRNQDLVKTIENWGTADNVPPLLKFFNHPHPWTREPMRKTVQALKPAPNQVIAQCVTDLDSFDQGYRNAALEWFAQNKPTDAKKRAEVAQALNKSIENEGSFNNGNLTRSLENWGTADNVPKLVPILTEARLGRGDVVRILGAIRDPNGLEAVAKRINNFFDRGEVYRTLKEAGPAAEPAVVKVMLTSTDAGTRVSCARLLGEVGTRNGSLAALQQVVLRFPQDAALRATATAAVQAISMRP